MILVSIDLSSAFDMVDHSILLGRLYTSFGISGTAFSWLRSCLTNCSQCVCAGQSSSTYKQCCSRVPQGSVLGPLLFTAYISPSLTLHPRLALLAAIRQRHTVVHIYFLI